MNNSKLPANPFQEILGIMDGKVTRYNNHKGLTKREEFARSAMQGILSNPYWDELKLGTYTNDAVAAASVHYADALLKHLEETQ